MNILCFLFEHGRKVLPPCEWEVLLNVHIIDADGWRDKNWKTPIGIVEFVERTAVSTIKVRS
jgi:hypothetical protein